MANEFLVAVNQKYQGKINPADSEFWNFNMSFENLNLTLPKLLNVIREGHAWTAPHHHVRHHRPTRRNPDYHTTYRVKANVMGSQLLALDSDTEDERSSFEALLANPFIAQHAALLHASASSTPGRPRTRIIFQLDTFLDREEYERALKALLARFPFCDQSVNHAAVVFYGAADCAYEMPDKVLPAAILREEIIAPFEARLQAERRRRQEARQRRLEARGRNVEPSNDQVMGYVRHVLRSVTEELAETPAGLGLRHQLLFERALQLGSLRTASWAPQEARQILWNLEDELFEAALLNGYVDDYGEQDTLRTIDDGVGIGETLPYHEPVWYAEQQFGQGDAVEVVIEGEVAAQGTVKRYRELEEYWEYELAERPRVWYPQNLLRRAVPEEETGKQADEAADNSAASGHA